VSNKELYRNICAQKKDVPLFLQHWWLDAVCNDWDAAIAKKGEQVTGIWPYQLEKKSGMALLRNPKLTPYLGPHIFYPNDIKESNLDSFEYDTLAELTPQLPTAKVWNLALQPGLKQAGIFKNNGTQLQVQQTFLIDLQQGEQMLFANMKENMRRNIRAAEKEITISNSPEYLPDLYNFQKNTLEGKGKKQFYNLADLQKIIEACFANNAAALWVAKKEDKVQAIVWHGWDEQNSYYLMGGQNPAADSYRAMSALLWYAIKEAKKRGNTAFDMEGSMDAGVERFFRGFAGNRTLYMILKKNESFLWKLKELLGR